MKASKTLVISTAPHRSSGLLNMPREMDTRRRLFSRVTNICHAPSAILGVLHQISLYLDTHRDGTRPASQTCCLSTADRKSLLRGHHAYTALPKSSGIAAGPSCRGALLAQNAEQSELAWQDPLGAIPADQGTVPAASTKAALLLPRVAGYRHPVNQPLTSPSAGICTLGSVGAGDG